MYAVIALMMSSFLVSLDMMIVDTAIPRIVGSLGGFSLLTWLISGYLLASTVTMPLYGKLSDTIGRKITFTIGAVVFVIGSALCGLSQSMGQLILFRVVQGLGAGAILPTVQTLIGDLFSPAERARFTAWFAGVWGFSALIGPLVGGLFVDYLSWRWIFFINLPIGAVALFLVWRHLEEKVQRKPAQPDYAGAAALTAGITSLMLLLMLSGTHYPWLSLQSLGLGLVAIISLTLFVWQEGRAVNPVLPLGLFRHRGIAVAVMAGFLLSGVLFGVTVYLPLWVQGVQGYSATLSGASLLWLSLGWPLAATVAGRLVMRFGTRPLAIAGTMLVAAGGSALVWLVWNYDPIPTAALAATTFVTGCGMGFSTLAYTMGLQHLAEWSVRGVATAAQTFMRTMGGMVWVSAMGGIMNVTLLGRLQQLPGNQVTTPHQAGELANNLLDPQLWATFAPAQLALLRGALADSLRATLLLMIVAGLLAAAVTLALPNIRFQAPQPALNPDPEAQPQPQAGT